MQEAESKHMPLRNVAMINSVSTATLVQATPSDAMAQRVSELLPQFVKLWEEFIAWFEVEKTKI